MSPGDYIFTGGLFAGAGMMIWLDAARRAESMGIKDSWNPWRAIKREKHRRFIEETLPGLVSAMRNVGEACAFAAGGVYEIPSTIRVVDFDGIDAQFVDLPQPRLTKFESTATLADHNPANAVAHTAPDDAPAATRPPGDQQHGDASASSAVATDGAAPVAAPRGSRVDYIGKPIDLSTRAAAQYIIDNIDALELETFYALSAALAKSDAGVFCEPPANMDAQ